MKPDAESVLNEFLSKASPKIVNGVVAVLGIVVIIFVGILLYIVLKKIHSSFTKEEKYNKLLEEFIDTNRALNELNDISEKTINITSVIKQFSYDINMLIYQFCNNKDDFDKDNEIKCIIESIINSVSSSLKSAKGEIPKCIFWIPDDDVKNLIRFYTNIIDENNNRKLPINNSFAGRIFSSGKERNCGNIDNDSEFQRESRQKRKYTSLAGVPIKWHNKIIGVLTIDAKKEDAFNDLDMDILNIFAYMLGICYLLFKK